MPVHLDVAPALITLLGCPEDSSRLKDFVSAIGGKEVPEPVRKAYPDVTYLNWFDLGLSLQLELGKEGQPGNKLVSAIDVYNAPEAPAPPRGVKNEYKQFPALPLDLSGFTPTASAGTGHQQGNTVATEPTGSHSATPSGSLILTSKSTGTDFVRAWGEPTRKGGGSGPAGRGPGVWMEWSGSFPLEENSSVADSTPITAPAVAHDTEAPEVATVGDARGGATTGRPTIPLKIMVELDGPGARGPKRWEADNAGSSPWKVLTFIK